jgi:hypothetical protein
MDFRTWFKTYRKRHPYTWRNKSEDELRLLYEKHKLLLDQEELEQKKALKEDSKITEDSRKNLVSSKGPATFISTCHHCWKHNIVPVCYLKKEITCVDCSKNYIARKTVKFKPQKKIIERLDFGVAVINVFVYTIVTFVALPLVIIGVNIIWCSIIYSPEERAIIRQTYLLNSLEEESRSRTQKMYRTKKRIFDELDEGDLMGASFAGEDWKYQKNKISQISQRINKEAEKLKQLKEALKN